MLLAMGANLVIAAAKIGAGLKSGSTVMLAEAAHSVADSMNEVFLLVALSLSARPPDRLHPFGHGKERFFWTFLATVFLFLSGAAFSVGQGLHALLSGGTHDTSGYVYAFAVLAVAFIAEGVSWRQALRQSLADKKRMGLSLFDFLRFGKDPTVKLVLSEDSVALLGVTIAASGLALHYATGDYRWDAGASILIGFLLVAVAFALGGDAKGLLLGESALPSESARLCQVMEETAGVAKVVELMTMALGPHSLLVAARVRLEATMDSADIAKLATDIDRRMREAVPDVSQVFIDPTGEVDL